MDLVFQALSYLHFLNYSRYHYSDLQMRSCLKCEGRKYYKFNKKETKINKSKLYEFGYSFLLAPFLI